MSGSPALRIPADLPLAFVLPEGSERPSGGNLYNLALLGALEERVPVERLSAKVFRTWLEQGRAGLYLLDTLDLRASGGIDRRGPRQHFGLVVHHLPSLEPDLPPDDPGLGLETEALARFDLFVCTSTFTAAHLRQRGVPEEKLITVPPAPPAVDRDVRRYEPPLRGLVVGNLLPRKGVLPLLELLAERRDPVPFSLSIVGRSDIDPVYASACRRVVERSPYLGERVRFESEVPYEGMGAHYRAADLLLSAARMETFGMAIQEACAYGLPVLVHDGGFARHHVTEGGNGVLVSGVEELAAAFLRFSREAESMRELTVRAERVRPAPGYGWPEAAESLLRQLGWA